MLPLNIKVASSLLNKERKNCMLNLLRSIIQDILGEIISQKFSHNIFNNCLIVLLFMVFISYFA
jgi:hypothetical protein